MLEIDVDHEGNMRLIGEANIHHAQQLHETLASVLKTRPDDLVLDLSGLTDLDTAGAQILIAFKRAVQSLRVHSCPDGMRDFLGQTGLVFLLV